MEPVVSKPGEPSALTEEEKLYLILHVNRICIKEGM